MLFQNKFSPWDEIESLNEKAWSDSLAKAKEPLESAAPVTTFVEAQEVFVCPVVQTVTEPGAEPLRAGTTARSDGAAHARRRPLISRTTTEQAKKWLQDGRLKESFKRALMAEVGNQSTVSHVTIDLVRLAKRVFTELAADLAGLRGFEDDHVYAKLAEIRDGFAAVVALRFVDDPVERQACVVRSAVAMRRYEVEFYEPALEWHREQIRLYEQGVLAKRELPTTLLMLIASNKDRFYQDRANALRETLGVMNAANDTGASALVNTFAEIEDWVYDNPNDRLRTRDSDFLFLCTAENVRLHSSFRVVARRATDDFRLSDGTSVAAGQRIGIMMHHAGRDPEVFGPDAHTFNPFRALDPEVPPYGLGFGHGAHMCVGRNFILGWHGTDGAVPQLLRWLYELDATRSDACPPQYCTDVEVDRWDRFPITLEIRRVEEW